MLKKYRHLPIHYCNWHVYKKNTFFSYLPMPYNLACLKLHNSPNNPSVFFSDTTFQFKSAVQKLFTFYIYLSSSSLSSSAKDIIFTFHPLNSTMIGTAPRASIGLPRLISETVLRNAQTLKITFSITFYPHLVLLDVNK